MMFSQLETTLDWHDSPTSFTGHGKLLNGKKRRCCIVRYFSENHVELTRLTWTRLEQCNAFKFLWSGVTWSGCHCSKLWSTKNISSIWWVKQAGDLVLCFDNFNLQEWWTSQVTYTTRLHTKTIEVIFTQNYAAAKHTSQSKLVQSQNSDKITINKLPYLIYHVTCKMSMLINMNMQYKSI